MAPTCAESTPLWARLGTTAHFCKVVILKLRAVPSCADLVQLSIGTALNPALALGTQLSLQKKPGSMRGLLDQALNDLLSSEYGTEKTVDSGLDFRVKFLVTFSVVPSSFGSGPRSGSEEGSYLRLTYFVYHSTLGWRKRTKKKRRSAGDSTRR